MRSSAALAGLSSCLFLFVLIGGCSTDSTVDKAEPAPRPSQTSSLETGEFTAEIDGRSIHYVVSGTGPPLMVLPNSWGLTLDGLQSLFSGLEDEFTLVYFDPRGMGSSGEIREDADMGLAAVRTDFDNLRQHLGLDQVRAIGWSNGAGNLIYHAAEYPETISQAVFLHGIARFSPEEMGEIGQEHPELFAAFGAIQQELSDESLADDEKDARWKRFVVETWFPELFADPEAGREALGQIFAGSDMSWRHNVYSNLEAAEGYDSRDQLGSITARSLVIAGAEDLMPPERTEEIHSGIADSEFIVFENSGHFAPVEEPDLFESTVIGFLSPAT